MTPPPDLEPRVADRAPTGSELTEYDRLHLVTYLRLLDAAAEEAPWEEVCGIVLRIDPELRPQQAKLTYESHLARARWMTEAGYRHLLDAARQG